MASVLPGKRSSGKLQDQAILLQLYVWSSRPGRSFMVSGTGNIHMQYRLLGNSGLRVSEAALGTMTFGEDWGCGTAKDEARKVYDAFREAGGNFIDTANLYKNGNNESILGAFMQGHRHNVIIAT